MPTGSDTQSRIASSIAARSVRSPDFTGTTVAPKRPHAIDVRRLARDVDLAHVHGARQTDARARRGRRDAVLARARLRDDALRAERLREQRLADAVVDLVRARVREVLALEPDVRAPAFAERGHAASARSAGRSSTCSSRASAAWNSADGRMCSTPCVSRSIAGISVSGT